MLTPRENVSNERDIRQVKGVQELIKKGLGTTEHMRLVNRDQPSARKALTRGLQGGGDGRRMVRIVINEDDIERALIHWQRPLVTQFEAPFNAAKALKGSHDHCGIDTYSTSGGQGRQRILNVIDTRQLQANSSIHRQRVILLGADAEAGFSIQLYVVGLVCQGSLCQGRQGGGKPRPYI